MSNLENERLNEMLFELAEEQLEWDTHRKVHCKHPRPGCPFCEQDADVPVEVYENNRDSEEAGVI